MSSFHNFSSKFESINYFLSNLNQLDVRYEISKCSNIYELECIMSGSKTILDTLRNIMQWVS